MKEPIRKRAYHRALKRNEPWALLKKSIAGAWKNIAADLYCPDGRAYLVQTSPFLKLIGLKESLEPSPIKIIYDKKDD